MEKIQRCVCQSLTCYKFFRLKDNHTVQNYVPYQMHSHVGGLMEKV
jgi:hypothetical protein